MIFPDTGRLKKICNAESIFVLVDVKGSREHGLGSAGSFG